MLAWDQVPHWGKREKKGGVGEKPRRKGDAALSPLPRSPLGSRYFFYLTPFFAFLPYCGAWSHATFMLPIVITLCLFSSICIIGHFRVSTAHFFLKLPKRNGANHFIFRPGISCFLLSMLSTLDLL